MNDPVACGGIVHSSIKFRIENLCFGKQEFMLFPEMSDIFRRQIKKNDLVNDIIIQKISAVRKQIKNLFFLPPKSVPKFSQFFRGIFRYIAKDDRGFPDMRIVVIPISGSSSLRDDFGAELAFHAGLVSQSTGNLRD